MRRSPAVESLLRERVEREIPSRYVERTMSDLIDVYEGLREPTVWESDTFTFVGIPLDVDPCSCEERLER